MPCACSDVQYADIPDGVSFHGVPRYYRNSLTATRRAVEQGWVPAGVHFGIHFGDILDGYQPKVCFVSAAAACKAACNGIASCGLLPVCLCQTLKRLCIWQQPVTCQEQASGVLQEPSRQQLPVWIFTCQGQQLQTPSPCCCCCFHDPRRTNQRRCCSV